MTRVKRSIKDNNKYYLYCFSPGKTEVEYFRNYIREVYSDKICFAPKDTVAQIISHKEITNIIKYIRMRFESTPKQGKGKIVVLLTDCDGAKLSDINNLYLQFKNTFSDSESLFILNYNKFEDWVSFYYDEKINVKSSTDKEKIRKDVYNNWEKRFKSKHEAANKNYRNRYNLNKIEKQENYSNITQPSYSDFPYVFDYIRSLK